MHHGVPNSMQLQINSAEDCLIVLHGLSADGPLRVQVATELLHEILSQLHEAERHPLALFSSPWPSQPRSRSVTSVQPVTQQGHDAADEADEAVSATGNKPWMLCLRLLLRAAESTPQVMQELASLVHTELLLRPQLQPALMAALMLTLPSLTPVTMPSQAQHTHVRGSAVGAGAGDSLATYDLQHLLRQGVPPSAADLMLVSAAASVRAGTALGSMSGALDNSALQTLAAICTACSVLQLRRLLSTACSLLPELATWLPAATGQLLRMASGAACAWGVHEHVLSQAQLQLHQAAPDSLVGCCALMPPALFSQQQQPKPHVSPMPTAPPASTPRALASSLHASDPGVFAAPASVGMAGQWAGGGGGQTRATPSMLRSALKKPPAVCDLLSDMGRQGNQAGLGVGGLIHAAVRLFVAVTWHEEQSSEADRDRGQGVGRVGELEPGLRCSHMCHSLISKTLEEVASQGIEQEHSAHWLALSVVLQQAVQAAAVQQQLARAGGGDPGTRSFLQHNLSLSVLADASTSELLRSMWATLPALAESIAASLPFCMAVAPDQAAHRLLQLLQPLLPASITLTQAVIQASAHTAQAAATALAAAATLPSAPAGPPSAHLHTSRTPGPTISPAAASIPPVQPFFRHPTSLGCNSTGGRPVARFAAADMPPPPASLAACVTPEVHTASRQAGGASTGRRSVTWQCPDSSGKHLATPTASAMTGSTMMCPPSACTSLFSFGDGDGYTAVHTLDAPHHLASPQQDSLLPASVQEAGNAGVRLAVQLYCAAMQACQGRGVPAGDQGSSMLSAADAALSTLLSRDDLPSSRQTCRLIRETLKGTNQLAAGSTSQTGTSTGAWVGQLQPVWATAAGCETHQIASMEMTSPSDAAGMVMMLPRTAQDQFGSPSGRELGSADLAGVLQQHVSRLISKCLCGGADSSDDHSSRQTWPACNLTKLLLSSAPPSSTSARRHHLSTHSFLTSGDQHRLPTPAPSHSQAPHVNIATCIEAATDMLDLLAFTMQYSPSGSTSHPVSPHPTASRQSQPAAHPSNSPVADTLASILMCVAHDDVDSCTERLTSDFSTGLPTCPPTTQPPNPISPTVTAARHRIRQHLLSAFIRLMLHQPSAVAHAVLCAVGQQVDARKQGQDSPTIHASAHALSSQQSWNTIGRCCACPLCASVSGWDSWRDTAHPAAAVPPRDDDVDGRHQHDESEPAARDQRVQRFLAALVQLHAHATQDVQQAVELASSQAAGALVLETADGTQAAGGIPLQQQQAPQPAQAAGAADGGTTRGDDDDDDDDSDDGFYMARSTAVAAPPPSLHTMPLSAAGLPARAPAAPHVHTACAKVMQDVQPWSLTAEQTAALLQALTDCGQEGVGGHAGGELLGVSAASGQVASVAAYEVLGYCLAWAKTSSAAPAAQSSTAMTALAAASMQVLQQLGQLLHRICGTARVPGSSTVTTSPRKPRQCGQTGRAALPSLLPALIDILHHAEELQLQPGSRCPGESQPTAPDTCPSQLVSAATTVSAALRALAQALPQIAAHRTRQPAASARTSGTRDMTVSLHSVLEQLAPAEQRAASAQAALLLLHSDAARQTWQQVARTAAAQPLLGTAVSVLLQVYAALPHIAATHITPHTRAETSARAADSAPGIHKSERPGAAGNRQGTAATNTAAQVSSLVYSLSSSLVPALLAVAAALVEVACSDGEAGAHQDEGLPGPTEGLKRARAGEREGVAAADDAAGDDHAGDESMTPGVTNKPRKPPVSLGSLCGGLARHLLTGAASLPDLLGPQPSLLGPLTRIACSTSLPEEGHSALDQQQLGSSAGTTNRLLAAPTVEAEVNAEQVVVLCSRLVAQLLIGQMKAHGGGPCMQPLCPLVLLRKLSGERAARRPGLALQTPARAAAAAAGPAASRAAGLSQGELGPASSRLRPRTTSQAARSGTQHAAVAGRQTGQQGVAAGAAAECLMVKGLGYAAWAQQPGLVSPNLAANTLMRLLGCLWRHLRRHVHGMRAQLQAQLEETELDAAECTEGVAACEGGAQRPVDSAGVPAGRAAGRTAPEQVELLSGDCTGGTVMHPEALLVACAATLNAAAWLAAMARELQGHQATRMGQEAGDGLGSVDQFPGSSTGEASSTSGSSAAQVKLLQQSFSGLYQVLSVCSQATGELALFMACNHTVHQSPVPPAPAVGPCDPHAPERALHKSAPSSNVRKPSDFQLARVCTLTALGMTAATVAQDALDHFEQFQPPATADQLLDCGPAHAASLKQHRTAFKALIRQSKVLQRAVRGFDTHKQALFGALSSAPADDQGAASDMVQQQADAPATSSNPTTGVSTVASTWQHKVQHILAAAVVRVNSQSDQVTAAAGGLSSPQPHHGSQDLVECAGSKAGRGAGPEQPGVQGVQGVQPHLPVPVWAPRKPFSCLPHDIPGDPLDLLEDFFIGSAPIRQEQEEEEEEGSEGDDECQVRPGQRASINTLAALPAPRQRLLLKKHLPAVPKHAPPPASVEDVRPSKQPGRKAGSSKQQGAVSRGSDGALSGGDLDRHGAGSGEGQLAQPMVSSRSRAPEAPRRAYKSPRLQGTGGAVGRKGQGPGGEVDPPLAPASPSIGEPAHVARSKATATVAAAAAALTPPLLSPLSRASLPGHRTLMSGRAQLIGASNEAQLQAHMGPPAPKPPASTTTLAHASAGAHQPAAQGVAQDEDATRHARAWYGGSTRDAGGKRIAPQCISKPAGDLTPSDVLADGQVVGSSPARPGLHALAAAAAAAGRRAAGTGSGRSPSRKAGSSCQAVDAGYSPGGAAADAHLDGAQQVRQVAHAVTTTRGRARPPREQQVELAPSHSSDDQEEEEVQVDAEQQEDVCVQQAASTRAKRGKMQRAGRQEPRVSGCATRASSSRKRSASGAPVSAAMQAACVPAWMRSSMTGAAMLKSPARKAARLEPGDTPGTRAARAAAASGRAASRATKKAGLGSAAASMPALKKGSVNNQVSAAAPKQQAPVAQRKQVQARKQVQEADVSDAAASDPPCPPKTSKARKDKPAARVAGPQGTAELALQGQQAGKPKGVKKGKGAKAAADAGLPATAGPSAAPGSVNPYINACLVERAEVSQEVRRRPVSRPAASEPDASDAEAGWSDLEDFIVCQPGRDYGQLLNARFQDCGGRSSSEEGDEDEVPE